MDGTQQDPSDEQAIELEELADVEVAHVALVEPDPLEVLREELDATEARLRTVSAAYKTLQSDMNGYKQRTTRQLELKLEIAKGDAVSRLFPGVTNLRRSIDAARNSADAGLLEGLEMVHRELMGGFEKLGLEEVSGIGAFFDPLVHEALSVIPVQDEALHDRVVQVFSSGYRVGTRLIAPAKVIIGAWTPPPAEE